MKRALLIGINYIGTKSQLSGCINDVTRIKKLLIESFGYDEANIIMLTDDNKSVKLIPTKKNILKWIDTVVGSTSDSDTLFIHYSGHGSQVLDISGDEKSNTETPGQDDVLCPSDYDKYNGTDGFILDDYLKENIVNKLPSGAKLRVFFDCCCSGTMLDLPFTYKNNMFVHTDKSDIQCDNCIMISGCRDDQTSADAYINKQYSGALTWALIKVLSNIDKVPTTWHALLLVIQHYLATDKYTQVPVLCVGNKKLLKQTIDL